MKVRIVGIEFEFEIPEVNEDDNWDISFEDELWDDVDVDDPIWVEMLNKRFEEVS